MYAYEVISLPPQVTPRAFKVLREYLYGIPMSLDILSSNVTKIEPTDFIQIVQEVSVAAKFLGFNNLSLQLLQALQENEEKGLSTFSETVIKPEKVIKCDLDEDTSFNQVVSHKLENHNIKDSNLMNENYMGEKQSDDFNDFESVTSVHCIDKKLDGTPSVLSPSFKVKVVLQKLLTDDIDLINDTVFFKKTDEQKLSKEKIKRIGTIDQALAKTKLKKRKASLIASKHIQKTLEDGSSYKAISNKDFTEILNEKMVEYGYRIMLDEEFESSIKNFDLEKTLSDTGFSKNWSWTYQIKKQRVYQPKKDIDPDFKPKRSVKKAKRHSSFLCSICGKQFRNIESKLMHSYADHAEPAPFSCKEKNCTYKVPYSEKMLIHLFQKHKIKVEQAKIFQCVQCSYLAITSKSIQDHVITHKPMEKLQCPACDKTFSNAGSLRKHKNQAHNPNIFNCSFCHEPFSSPTHLKRHVANMHISKVRNWKCPYCDHATVQKNNCRIHIRLKHKGNPVTVQDLGLDNANHN